MNLNLQGKRALVFGSTQGLGKAIAESMIAEGAEVTLCARNQERLNAVRQEIGACAAVSADLTIAGEATRACRLAEDSMSGIDIVVTNTGGPSPGDFLSIPIAQWQTDFQSLWMSVVETLHFVLPKMKSQNFGRVIMISSIAASEPMAKLTTSNGLRAGLSGLCKSVANEVAEFGVTLNIVQPGYIDTNRMRELNFTHEYVSKIAPARRPGHPQEVGDLVTFLASTRAGYITGQSFTIDGGALRSHN